MFKNKESIFLATIPILVALMFVGAFALDYMTVIGSDDPHQMAKYVNRDENISAIKPNYVYSNDEEYGELVVADETQEFLNFTFLGGIQLHSGHMFEEKTLSNISQLTSSDDITTIFMSSEVGYGENIFANDTIESTNLQTNENHFRNLGVECIMLGGDSTKLGQKSINNFQKMIGNDSIGLAGQENIYLNSVRDKKITIMGYNFGRNNFSLSYINSQIIREKKNTDVLILLIDAKESKNVSFSLRLMCKYAVSAGANIVICDMGENINGMEIYKDVSIIYGLGSIDTSEDISTLLVLQQTFAISKSLVVTSGFNMHPVSFENGKTRYLVADEKKDFMNMYRNISKEVNFSQNTEDLLIIDN